MKKLLCAVALLTPVAAFATPTPGAYVQAVAGGNATFLDDNYSFSSDETATGWAGGLAVGYLWGCDFQYGVELGGLIYPNSTTSVTESDIYGNSVKTNLKIDGDNIDLLGVAKYNFDSGVNVFAKAGAAYVNQKLTFNANGNVLGQGFGFGGSDTESKVAPEVALGVGYQFDQNWEMNLTANTIFAGDNGPNTNANLLLGVTYHFA